MGYEHSSCTQFAEVDRQVVKKNSSRQMDRVTDRHYENLYEEENSALSVAIFLSAFNVMVYVSSS